MKVQALVVLGAALFMAAVGVLVSVRLWRNEAALFDSPPRAWPFGERSWARVARAFPVGVLGMAATFAAVAPLGFVERPCSGAGCTVVDLAATAALVLFAATLLVSVSVALYARPRLFVPPHMRRAPRVGGGAPAHPGVVRAAAAPPVRHTYRDPQLLRFQATVVGGLLALMIATGVVFWPDKRALLCLVLVPVFVVLGARASRQGVRTDEEGLTVRDQWNHERRLRWLDVERFELVAGEGARAPTAFARLVDGTQVELAPLSGADAQSSSHRRRWAEQSVAGLNAQLREARGRYLLTHGNRETCPPPKQARQGLRVRG